MSPKKVALVAGREFMAAVTNKGFLIGLLIMPVMFAVIFALMPRLMTSNSTIVRGDVAVVDPTGRVAPVLRETITPDAIRARGDRNMARALNATGVSGDVAARTRALVRAVGAEFRLVERPPDVDLAAETREGRGPAIAPGRTPAVALHQLRSAGCCSTTSLLPFEPEHNSHTSATSIGIQKYVNSGRRTPMTGGT